MQRHWHDTCERVLIAWYRRDLVWLGQHFNTDKWGAHFYLRHYQAHFQPFRLRHLNLLEIGVGGYADPALGGNSLRMWKAYFPKANICGVDVYDKSRIEEERIRIFQGSQVDETFLAALVQQTGGFDIVVDDGSHINAHVIKTFEILFPLLRSPGLYAIEDTQTSYWPTYGGSSDDVMDPRTIMGYFTRVANSLNYEEVLRENYAPTVFDRHVVAVHFYHNLILIHKGENAEGSESLRRYGDDPRTRIDGPPNPCQP